MTPLSFPIILQKKKLEKDYKIKNFNEIYDNMCIKQQLVDLNLGNKNRNIKIEQKNNKNFL